MELGLSDKEFWSLTLKELDALFKQKRKIEKRQKKTGDYQAGVVASTIANCFRDTKKKKEPYQPKDFMPDYEKKPKDKRQTWREQLKMVEVLNAAFNGKDKRGGAA